MSKCDACLRFNQVILYVITLASGLATCLGSGWVSRILGGKCILGSNMVFQSGPNGTIALSTLQSTWGDEWRCAYCTFTTATAAIYAIIWFWFYVLLSEHKYSVMEDRLKLAGLLNFRQESDESPPDFKLFVPSLLLNIILFICVCVSIAFLNGGFNQWCANYTSTSGHPCDYLGRVVWANVEGGDYVFIYTKVALAGNWTLFVALLVKIVLLSCRIYHYFSQLRKSAFRDDFDGQRSTIREELMIDDRCSNASGEEHTDGAFLIAV